MYRTIYHTLTDYYYQHDKRINMTVMSHKARIDCLMSLTHCETYWVVIILLQSHQKCQAVWHWNSSNLCTPHMQENIPIHVFCNCILQKSNRFCSYNGPHSRGQVVLEINQFPVEWDFHWQDTNPSLVGSTPHSFLSTAVLESRL